MHKSQKLQPQKNHAITVVAHWIGFSGVSFDDDVHSQGGGAPLGALGLLLVDEGGLFDWSLGWFALRQRESRLDHFLVALLPVQEHFVVAAAVLLVVVFVAVVIGTRRQVTNGGRQRTHDQIPSDGALLQMDIGQLQQLNFTNICIR
jgi:hypothetical protein